MSVLKAWWVIPVAAWVGVVCAFVAQAYIDRIRAGATLNTGTLVDVLAGVLRRQSRPELPGVLPWLCAGVLIAAWWSLAVLPVPDRAARAAACAVLLMLAVIDARSGYLPDALTLPLLGGGLLVAWLGEGVRLQDAVLAAFFGYLVLRLFNAVFRRLRHRQGMGGGDMKLLAALGAWLGWAPLPGLLLVACVGGIVFAVLRPGPASWSRPLAFGPFLATAGVLGLVGQPVVQFHF